MQHLLLPFITLQLFPTFSSQSFSHLQSPNVKLQYEAYPYPHGNDNSFIDDHSIIAPPPILQAPSHLAAINHHIFNGEMDWCKPVKILIAGGGTGEKTIQIVKQLVASKSQSNWKVIHLDLSNHSVSIAKNRIIRMFGEKILQSVEFIVGNLLDIGNGILPYEKFDYIDCLGVLHTLKAPSIGLSLLKRRLKENGGIGIMVYAKIGRAGIINFQSIMKLVLNNDPTRHSNSDFLPSSDESGEENELDEGNENENICLAKSLLKVLPSTNQLKLNKWRWNKLKNTIYNNTKNSGIVDLFMPAHDVPMNIDDVYQLVLNSGMKIQSFLHPSLYQLKSYIHDIPLLNKLLKRLNTKQKEEKFIEMFSGNMFHHFFFVTKIGNNKKKIVNWKKNEHLIPIPLKFNGTELGLALYNLKYYPWNYNNFNFFFKLPKLNHNESSIKNGTKENNPIYNILKLITGQNTIKFIRDHCSLNINEFNFIFQSLYNILNGQGKLYLSMHPVTFEENDVSEGLSKIRNVLYPHVAKNSWHYFDCQR
jgi:SAM-dependent methyltransferase